MTQPIALLDLSQCADEKIQFSGGIQPHGVLIALTEPDLSIVQASDSVFTVFGTTHQELVGQPLQALIGEEQQIRLLQDLSTRELFELNPLRLRISCKPDPKEFDAVFHRVDGLLILELEAPTTLQPVESLEFFRTSNEAVRQILACNSRQELLQSVADFVQKLTGFDRVMIYLFDREWNGIVAAECLTEGMVSYLGLHFPASDIPAQARELYRRNRLRLLVDVDAKPSPMVPADNPLTGAPIDLSGSILRSMSPVHIEYLKNMGVAASMSLSLISNDQLKGLICCHQVSAGPVDYAVRQACEFLSLLVSLQMDTLEERDNYKRVLELKDSRKELLLHLCGQDDLPLAIAGSGKLLEAAGAAGAAVVWDGQCFLTGKTPDLARVTELVMHLSENMVGPIFSSSELSKSIDSAQGLETSACGLLAIRIGTTGSKWILWFRQNQVQEVSWAGNPDKLASIDADMRIHPRKSFDLWKENVVSKSVPWSDCEIQSALELRTGLLDAALSMAEKMRSQDFKNQVHKLSALNSELELVAEQLRQARDAAQSASLRKSEMVSVVSHDLRAPLTSISGALSLLASDLYEVSSEEADLVRIARNGTTYLLKLIEDLLNLDSLESGIIEIERVELPISELVNDAFYLIRSIADKSEIELVSMVQPATVSLDRDRILQVLINLISNAIKFSPRKSRIVVSSTTTDEGTVIKVTDEGRGIPEEFRESIFQRFKQVEIADRTDKGGTGLGLSICKSMVEAHGGRIDVQSQLNGGSTFRFTLPTVKE